jgi:predicted RNA-binding protein with PUA-like domain
MAKPQHWLLKSEPTDYSYAQLEKDGRAHWTGIRNPEARKHLRSMKPGDLALYYHTGKEKAVVGVAEILTEAGPDPTAPGEDWAALDIGPSRRLATPVTLAEMKADRALKGLVLLTRPRLSAMPVSPEHFQYILKRSAGRR